MDRLLPEAPSPPVGPGQGVAERPGAVGGILG